MPINSASLWNLIVDINVSYPVLKKGSSPLSLDKRIMRTLLLTSLSHSHQEWQALRQQMIFKIETPVFDLRSVR